MKVVVLEFAERDLGAGKDFYDLQGETAGDYFVDSLSADIESLALFAGIHRRTGRFYRSLAHTFPYAIYYTMEQDEITVWAVLDCRRDPSWIQKQLRRRK
jgi:plasmid stabilization system protein ParE